MQRWPDPPPLPRHETVETTVVVPCYNHADFLPLAVESLLEQTLAGFDTVLVDDASTDGTRGLLQGLAAALASRGRVTVLGHDTNVGQAATLNEGIGAAVTPLVTVLNDDDWLTPTALETALSPYRDGGDVALVGAGSRWFTGRGRPPEHTVDAPPARRVEPAHVRGMNHPNDLNMTHSGMTVARAAWEIVGGYNPDVSSRVVPFSDRDFQLRVAALYPVAIVDAPLVWWRSDSSVDAGLNS